MCIKKVSTLACLFLPGKISENCGFYFLGLQEWLFFKQFHPCIGCAFVTILIGKFIIIFYIYKCSQHYDSIKF